PPVCDIFFQNSEFAKAITDQKPEGTTVVGKPYVVEFDHPGLLDEVESGEKCVGAESRTHPHRGESVEADVVRDGIVLVLVIDPVVGRTGHDGAANEEMISYKRVGVARRDTKGSIPQFPEGTATGRFPGGHDRRIGNNFKPV